MGPKERDELASSVLVIVETLREQAKREEVRAALRTIIREARALWKDLATESAAPHAAPAPSISLPPTRVAPPTSAAVTVENGASHAGRAGPPVEPKPIQRVPLKLPDGRTMEVNVPGTAEDAAAAKRSSVDLHAHEHARPTVLTSRWAPVSSPELDSAGKRSRLKAEACVLLAEAIEKGEDRAAATARLEPGVSARAQGVGHGRYWMFEEETRPVSPQTLRRIAACYENLAIGAEMAAHLQRRIDSESATPPESFILLLAEVQSALRASVLDAGVDDDDVQMTVFLWLRCTCDLYRVFVKRYMRKTELADHNLWESHRRALADARPELGIESDEDKQRKKLRNKAQYHAKRIPAAEPDDALSDWKSLDAAVGEMLGAGEPPTSTIVRDILLPLHEKGLHPPEGAAGEGLTRAIRAVAAYAETRGPAEDPTEAEAPEEDRWNADVAQVRELLAGREAVLVGGIAKPADKARIEQAFGLKELHWVTTTARQSHSLSDLVPLISREEISIVIRLVGLTRTLYGGLADECRRFGKPFVNVPGKGVNPNGLASQALKQVGERLHELYGQRAEA